MKTILSIIPNHPGLNILYIGEDKEFEKLLLQKIEEIGADLDINLKDKTVRTYEYVFYIYDENDNIISKIYNALENSGSLVAICKKEKAQTLMRVMEEANFVAVGDTEIDSKKSMVYGKKMHGWSNRDI